jgi:hypothetical protein
MSQFPVNRSHPNMFLLVKQQYSYHEKQLGDPFTITPRQLITLISSQRISEESLSKFFVHKQYIPEFVFYNVDSS